MFYDSYWSYKTSHNTMINMQEKDAKNKDIADKMEQVHAILEYLAKEHNLIYSLNFCKMMPDGIRFEINDHLYSETLDSIHVDYFHTQLEEYYKAINIIPNLVKTGEIMVICLDDTNPPEGIGDWPVKHGVYAVDMIRPTRQKGVFSYSLRGLNPNKPFDGYNSLRFQQIKVKEHQN